MKKFYKILCIIISLTIVSILVYFGVIFYNVFPKKRVFEDIKIYNELIQDAVFLPKVSELNNYSDLNFKYTQNKGVFSWYSYILKVTYSESDFKVEKSKIDENYYFDKIFSDVIEVDTFKIKLLDFEKYELAYPKYLAFVGVSESTNEIVYIYYKDEDLDTIGDSWEEFIIENCNW